MKIDFNDILIEPATASEIDTRTKVNTFYKHADGKHLPIIAAPMDTVVNDKSIKILEDLSINYCIPRGNSYNQSKYSASSGTMGFKSYGLDEFISYFLKMNIKPCEYILIDIANGHMEKLYNAIKDFRKKYKSEHYKLMVGNIANPSTYKLLSEAGANYIRVGIGNGNGCLTTQQTGVGYPMASLISECYRLSLELPYEKRAKIVADGGMKEYSDIIKALALGADYVMLGSLLNKAFDSAGPVTCFGIRINQHSDFGRWLYKNGLPLKKKFRGMSTKEVQKNWNKSILKTSEGVSRIYKIDYTLESWTKNLTDYLKSAMSYTDKVDLYNYVGGVGIIQISDNAYQRFKK